MVVTQNRGVRRPGEVNVNVGNERTYKLNDNQEFEYSRRMRWKSHSYDLREFLGHFWLLNEKKWKMKRTLENTPVRRVWCFTSGLSVAMRSVGVRAVEATLKPEAIRREPKRWPRYVQSCCIGKSVEMVWLLPRLTSIRQRNVKVIDLDADAQRLSSDSSPSWLADHIICHNGQREGGLQWLAPCVTVYHHRRRSEVQRVRFADDESCTLAREEAQNQRHDGDLPLPEQSASDLRISLTWYIFRAHHSECTVWYGRMSAPSRVRFWWMTHHISFVSLPSGVKNSWLPFVVNTQRIFQSYPRQHLLRTPALWMHSPYPAQMLSNLLK